MFRRFIAHQPWMLVSIALAALTIAGLVIPGFPSAVAAWMIAFALVMGLMLTFLNYRDKTYSALIGDFRKGFEIYRRVVGSEAENSPMRLMTRLSSQDVRESDKTRQQLWNVILEKTSVIDTILVQDIQDLIEFLKEFDPSGYDMKATVTTLADRIWRIANLYHGNVVSPSLRMREERAPHDKPLREDYSKFRMLYNDALEEIQAASEKANEEFGLGMKMDLRDLRLPEPQ